MAEQLPKQYSVTIQVNEETRWPDGTSGFYNALGGVLDDEANSLLGERLWMALSRYGPGVDVISVERR
jgi:hypothetical protein